MLSAAVARLLEPPPGRILEVDAAPAIEACLHRGRAFRRGSARLRRAPQRGPRRLDRAPPGDGATVDAADGEGTRAGVSRAGGRLQHRGAGRTARSRGLAVTPSTAPLAERRARSLAHHPDGAR